MKHRLTYFYSTISWLLILFFTLLSHDLSAQDELPKKLDLQQSLAKAEKLLEGFKNDSVYLIATQMLAELRARGEINSELGIRAQLLEGIALEQDQNDTIALRKLLYVKELSREKGLWKIYARASLTLSNLFEKINFKEQAYTHLQDAGVVVKEHQLDTLYALFAIRSASYNRLFGDKELALFYAKEALRTAEKYGLRREEATGHLLMGILHFRTDFDKARDHFIQAGKLYVIIDDYVGYSFINNNLTRLYQTNNQPLVALSYNDSTIMASKKAVEMGYERHYAIARAFRTRAELFWSMGQSDSAWVNLQKAYDLQLDNFSQGMEDKVLELDAKYHDELKTQRIEEQARQLQSERERKSLLATLFLVVLLFLALLAVYYFKLRNRNRQIAQQAEELKSLDLSKSRFFANISHELRTPLSLLLGPIHSLQKDRQLSGQQQQLLQMADRNGRQLRELINEILDLSKLEMGKMKLNTEPTDLQTFFRYYFAQFESMADRKRIDFSYDVFVDEPLAAEIDQTKCRQIIYNLLSNAFKFTPAGGRITAFVSFNHNWLELQISDNGPGIHPNDLPHVFDRYFQTSLPNKPAEGGTGIGLALCHEYAQLFGGKIAVESTLGNGAVFTFSFPITLVEDRDFVDGGEGEIPNLLYDEDTQPARESLDTSPAQPAPGLASEEKIDSLTQAAKARILVVEDNPDLQDYIRLVLSEKYEVVTAGNGREALDYLFPSTISTPSVVEVQLILSDLMMPVMDGYQLVEKLKTNDATRHIPVVMLTARADLQDKLKALRIGVDDYLLKPFDEEELLVRIENLLKNQSIRYQEHLADHQPGESIPILSQVDQQWLEAFEGYVQKNLSDSLLDLPQLTNAFTMSKSTLLRQLKRLTGLSPNQYIQEVRLNEARRLLEIGAYSSISQVADKVGYGDYRSLTRSFKKRFGKLPSEVEK